MARIYPFHERGRIVAMTTSTARIDQRIEDLAQRVRRDSNLFSFPVPLAELADSEGIRVFNADFRNPEIAGLITSEGECASIYLKENDDPARKRFTLAHELGHYFLHLKKGKASNFIDSILMFRTTDGQDSHDPEEIEANNFAAALLMPADEVRELREARIPLGDMADYFYVSLSALNNRLKNLGLSS